MIEGGTHLTQAIEAGVLWLAAYEGISLREYDPDQPRDEAGRFGSGGGSSGGGGDGGDGGGSSGGGGGGGTHAAMDDVLGDAALDMRIYSDLNDSPNKKEIGNAVAKHLKETSGADVSGEEGFKMARAVSQYAGNADNYRKVRSGEMPETSKQLDNLISKSDPYNGEIHRGMSFDNDSFVAGLSVGSDINMGGVSSWSSDKKHSEKFAGTKKVGVMLSVKNKTGASITFLSKDEREKEILSPSKAKYRVKSISQKSKGGKTIYNVRLEEK